MSGSIPCARAASFSKGTAIRSSPRSAFREPTQTNKCLLSYGMRTWAAPSESLQGERRVPMEKLTRLLIAAAVLVLAVLALCLALA